MKSIPNPLAALLFDLDGTLIDSVDDLACGVNLTLADLRLPPRERDDVARYIGDGVVSLLARSIAAARGADPWSAPDAGAARAALPIFRDHYNAHLTDSTTLLPGAAELLADLPSSVRVGLVTNKPERPARRILEALGVAERFTAVLGGDSLPTRKPDPALVLAALDACRSEPGEAILVGDGLNDARAGKAAGVTTVGIPSMLGRDPWRIEHEVDLCLPDLHALGALLIDR